MNSDSDKSAATSQPQNGTDDKHESESAGANPSSDGAAGRPATVIVRGETVANQSQKSPPKDSNANEPKKSPPKKLSEAKVKMQSLLPALQDDRDVGVQKEQVVVRDGKADLAFTGTLVASAAPTSAPEGHWEEYRVYETTAGKHVFSKITRKITAEAQDDHHAEIFDPAPASVSSKLIRGARDLTRSEPMTWTDAATEFFGYEPLAKALYRKLGDQFEEHVS